MHTFNYRTEDEYEAGLELIAELGVDFEAQGSELTIITDELTEAEERDMRTPEFTVKL